MSIDESKKHEEPKMKAADNAKLIGEAVAVNFGIAAMPNAIGKIGLPIFNPIDDVAQVVNYITTDQEKEGREKGKVVAAKIFKPIFEELKIKQSKIIDSMKTENDRFEIKAENLRKRYIECDNEITLLRTTIGNMYGQSVKIDNIITSMSNVGIIATLANPIFNNIFINIGLGGFLKNVMDKKREKYYQEELVNSSKIWEGKIAEVKKEIIKSLEALSLQKESNKQALQELEKLLEEQLNRYSEIKAQYNLLTIVR